MAYSVYICIWLLMQVIPFQLTGGFLVKLAVVKIFGYPKFEYPELTRPNKWVELTSWASNFLSTEMLNLCSTNLLNQPKFLGTLALSLASRGAFLFYSFYGLLLMKSKEFSFSLKIRIATNDYSPFASSLELICVYAKMDFCY